MKLVVQIPCRDEEECLPATLAELPRAVRGFDTVEWILIDDGSADRSVEVARAAGVDEVVALPGRRGLAVAFLAGLEAALRRGADVIVQTDADRQYPGADIGTLVRPILEGRADMVVGERPIAALGFSFVKSALQRIGSSVVRRISGTSVPDATSGFRAFSRDAALRINVFSGFSYTLETIIQLGLQGARVVSVPVGANRVERPSRLFRSMPEFVLRQTWTLLRVYLLYRPFELLASAGGLLVLLGTLPGLRFLFFLSRGGGQGHVQSLILATILILLGSMLVIAAVLASVSSANRILLEDLRLRLRRLELAEAAASTAGRRAKG